MAVVIPCEVLKQACLFDVATKTLSVCGHDPKLAQHVLERDLKPWEIVIVGAISGGVAGAVPRFFLIVPLGAMNFTGYELSRKVLMNKNQEVASERPPRKKFTNSG
ncbi:hypothetical protein MLD38_024198 [Melastoma candidum]|uniref:Uncharacterized protein n=1 Tax=Melastoma candidum TaxID=119954 RepID=A0ACB9NRN8_9MYRT|nr:hypothetical protein MLD38_024198 [Melastoma candidum]